MNTPVYMGKICPWASGMWLEGRMGVSTSGESGENFPHQDFEPGDLLGNFPSKKSIQA